MHKQRPFAVFDIDGTVIRWQLYHAVINELGRRGFIPKISADEIRTARMTWKKRTHSESFSQYEHELVHTYGATLKNIKITDYRDVIDAVFEEYKDQVYTYTRDLIRELKDKGYLLFAISGSHQEIIDKLGEYYGFNEYIGATHKIENEYFTGKDRIVVGRKGELLRELIEKHDTTLEGSIAVGDSEGDIQMFEIVQKPIVFNPTAGLYEVAKQNGWDIVIERKNVVYKLESTNGTFRLA
jgi:HAD superfamily hydrolase (TIGR01490 family)